MVYYQYYLNISPSYFCYNIHAHITFKLPRCSPRADLVRDPAPDSGTWFEIFRQVTALKGEKTSVHQQKLGRKAREGLGAALFVVRSI